MFLIYSGYNFVFVEKYMYLYSHKTAVEKEKKNPHISSTKNNRHRSTEVKIVYSTSIML